MDIDVGALKQVALAAARVGAVPVETVLTKLLTGVAGPFGLLVGPALNLVFPMINDALGLAPDTPPEQTAAAIEADPDAAKAKLDALAEDHQFQLAAAKQGQDFALAGQAQQVGLNTVEAQNPSLFVGGWRPALAWGLSAMLVLSFALPYLAWALLCFGLNVPAPPPLSAEATGFLAGLLGITVAARSYDKASGTAFNGVGSGTTRMPSPTAAAKRR